MKDKFKKGIAVGGTAFILGAGGTIAVDKQINPYTDVGDRQVVAMVQDIPKAGEAKVELIKARPEVRLQKWSGEVNLGVRYNKVKATGKRAFLTNRMEWKGIDEEVHAYPITDGLEIEVVLNKKPTTNVFEFQIDGYQDLDFFYQPPLTQKEIDRGAIRPDNVIGSYAVYSKSKKNYAIGSTNYATGKLYHIYRPKVIDANNVEVWGELAYSNGILSVTVPQGYLNNASYPVKIDPTFGTTSVGASETWNLNNEVGGDRYASPEAGTIDSISWYSSEDLSSNRFKGVFYNSDGTVVTNGVGNEANPNVSFGWVVSSFSTPPNMSAGTNYGITTVISGEPNFKYDTSASSYELYDGSNSYLSPQSIPTSDVGNWKYSLYATYTASGGGTPSSIESDLITFE